MAQNNLNINQVILGIIFHTLSLSACSIMGCELFFFILTPGEKKIKQNIILQRKTEIAFYRRLNDKIITTMIPCK